MKKVIKKKSFKQLKTLKLFKILKQLDKKGNRMNK